MDEYSGSDQNGLARQRHPGALEHHAEEDYQVSVPADQMQQVAQKTVTQPRGRL